MSKIIDQMQGISTDDAAVDLVKNVILEFWSDFGNVITKSNEPEYSQPMRESRQKLEADYEEVSKTRKISLNRRLKAQSLIVALLNLSRFVPLQDLKKIDGTIREIGMLKQRIVYDY